MAIRFLAMRPERVTQKVKALLACCLDAGLRFVQSKSELRHDAARPIQCLRRMSVAENDEVVRIRDHLSAAVFESQIEISRDPMASVWSLPSLHDQRLLLQNSWQIA